MREELRENLKVSYPKLKMAGCVGDGWFNLLDSVFSLISSHVKHKRSIRANALNYNRALGRARTDINDNARLKQVIQGKSNEWSNWHETEYIRAVANWKPLEVVERIDYPRVSDCKEKFGTLRLHINNTDEYVDGIVSMAEYMSGVTCENCGNVGKGGGRGWIKTYCDSCRDNLQKDA